MALCSCKTWVGCPGARGAGAHIDVDEVVAGGGAGRALQHAVVILRQAHAHAAAFAQRIGAARRQLLHPGSSLLRQSQMPPIPGERPRPPPRYIRQETALAACNGCWSNLPSEF